MSFPANPDPEDLVKSAERELAMRLKVYPKRVARNHMSQQHADYEIHCQEMILALLRQLANGIQPELRL